IITDSLLKGAQIVMKRPICCDVQNASDELLIRLIVRWIRIDPARVHLSLVKRFQHISLDALDELGILVIAVRLQGPGTQEGLVQQVLFVGIRRRYVLELDPVLPIELTPVSQAIAPSAG